MVFDATYERYHSHSLNTILSLISVGFILISVLIIIKTPTSSNYEFSIYDSYPFYFWLTIIAAIITSSTILLINGLGKKQYHFHFFLGFLMILLTDLILLLIPFIRGYYNYGSGDVLSHIGWMKDIIQTGYIGHSNMYPIDHILGVFLTFFSGLSLQQITMIIPALFSILFIISFYLLTMVIFSKQSKCLIVILFASILLFGNLHLSFTPNAQAFLILPFVLYLLFKSNIFKVNQVFSFLLIIMCILLVFFHPLIILIMISILILLKIVFIIQNRLNFIGTLNRNLNIVLLISIILFFSWSSYLFFLAKTAKPIILTIIGSGESVSEFQNYSNILSQVNLEIPYLIRLILSIYGQSIILGGISLICSIYLFLKIIRNEIVTNIHLISSIIFLLLFIVSIFMFFFNGAFGFNRIFSCALIFSIILVGSTFSMIKTDYKINTLLTGIAIMTILALIIWFSIFNLFLSPITKQVNQQVTKSEYIGMTTFYQIRDENKQILEHGLSQYRFYDAIYSRDCPRVNVQYPGPNNVLLPPDHFNYLIGSSLGDYYKEQKYFLLTNQGKFFYQNIYPEFQENWRFTPYDFERLNYDVSVRKIYNNGNLEIRLIN